MGPLRLQLAGPLPGREELGALKRRDAGLEAGVDVRLAAPDVDRLLADAQLLRDLGGLPARFDQLDHPTAKLRRVDPLRAISSSDQDDGSEFQFDF